MTTEEKRNWYEQEQLDKAERYEARAKKNAAQSEATLKQVRRERGIIPLGQPILVGHHSERRHRNHLESMNNRERRGWEEHDKAQHYEEKADRIRDNLETDKVISSDDPDAVVKLKAKVVKFEEERTKIKELNKKARKEGTDQAPGYLLKNLAGNIRSVKQRIATLEAVATIDDTDIERNGVTISKDVAENRVRLYFPGKPSDEVRSRLKASGFRWSPRAGAWQRHLNNAGIYAAERILDSLSE